VCVYPRICHLLRCACPSDAHGYAKRFDEMLLNALARAAGRVGGGIEDDGSTGIVRDRISLPVDMGGWGMRQWADLAPVAFLAGAAAALPSFIDRRITKHTGNKESGAGKGRDRGSGSSQNTSYTGSSRRRLEPPLRDLRSRLQHRYLPRTRSSAAHARAVAPGMFPHVGRGPLGEGAFDTRGHGYALLLQGRSTLGTELDTAWASARGQLNAALQVSASAPSARLREVQVGMAAAAKDGTRSRGWEARRRGSSCPHGATRRPGGCRRPGPEAPP
jgi:hypothetical protein